MLTYKEIDRKAWKQLLQSSPTATWFQSPEAYDFYASLPRLMTPFAWGVQRGERLVAVCVGYVTRWTRRAIIFGGPALAEDCTNDELQLLLSTNQLINPSTHQPIYIETRNFHDFSRWRSAFEACGFAYQPHYDLHIDCTAPDPLNQTVNDNRRRQITRALAAGATITEAASEQEVLEFYCILHHLYRSKLRLPLFPKEFFLQFYRQHVGKYLLVKHNGKVIAGMMCPIRDGKAIYEWYVCGDDRHYHDLYPSVMATWAAIDYAHRHQIPSFDLMGAGVPDVPYGVRDFKIQFGGQLHDYGRFLYITKPLLYRIGSALIRLIKRKL